MSKLPGRLSTRCGWCGPAQGFASQGISRRHFMAAGAAAVGLGLAAPAVTRAQAPAPARPRIDVHHHIVPPAQVEAQLAHRSAGPTKWSVSMSLDDMDKAGVATSITSIVNPGNWYGQVSEDSRKAARACNEYALKLGQDHPGRFRSFVDIILPDTEFALREIEYGLDVLKAEGVALWTSYDGKYLGDPAFVPVFEELNRRKAVVYTHPTTPLCCNALIKGVSTGTIEWATDTTRTVTSLIFGEAGTAHRFPDIRWIWAHSGGTLPFLTSRLVQQTRVKADPRMPDGPLPILRRFFYDVAQGNTPGQLAALLKLVPVSQVLFGSDFPYRPATEAVEGLADFKFSDADLRGINSENAVKLMPQLRA